MICRCDGTLVGVELKYFKAALDINLSGEHFGLKPGVSPDIPRAGFCRDLARLESWCQTGRLNSGAAILLTNDAALWLPATTSETFDAQFHVCEGKVLRGRLDWSAQSKNPCPSVVLAGEYRCTWQDYSRVERSRNGLFRYLLVELHQCQ